MDEDEKPELPYIFRRDSVQGDRNHKPIYLQDKTLMKEYEFQMEIEKLLGEEVPKADLREASYIVAMNNPDLVVEELRSWGYDY